MRTSGNRQGLDRSMSVTNSTPTTGDGFRHEALLYADDADYLDATIPFITDGLARDEPILIVVGTDKANLLRCALGRDADRVRFADMAAVGRNPARIIPAWRSFLDEHVPARRPVR